MSARAIVDLMVSLQDNRGADLKRAHGAGALAVAQEIEAALFAQMEQNLGHVLLWEQFMRTPREVDAALVGVVDALMSNDEVLAAWLASGLARYDRARRDRAS